MDAVHEAIQGGHGEIVSDLVENGASIDGKRHRWLHFHVATSRGGTEVAQLLLVLKGLT